MTKNSILLITIILFVNIGFGQSDEVKMLFKPTETDSLFITAIKNYTVELNSYDNQLTANGPNSKIIYIQYESYLSRIPKTINGYQIIQLGLGNRKKHFRKNKNRLSLVEISPLTLKDGLFSITLVPYGAKLKRKQKLELSYSHFNRTYFKYVGGKLIIEKIENGEI